MDQAGLLGTAPARVREAGTAGRVQLGCGRGITTCTGSGSLLRTVKASQPDACHTSESASRSSLHGAAPGGGAAQEGPHCKPLAANTPAAESGLHTAHLVQPLPLAKLFGHREDDLFDTVTEPPTATLGSGHRRLPFWLLDLDVSPTGFTTENPDWLDFFAMVFSQINGE